jgi:N-acyl-L-homoserine lactone synthetase
MINPQELPTLENEAVYLYTARDVAKENELAAEIDNRFTDIRTKYVLSHHWLPSIDRDLDEYDNVPDTNYVVHTTTGEGVDTGFRLTPIANTPYSLSAKMWQYGENGGIVQEVAREFSKNIDCKMAVESESLWDLTRFVENFHDGVDKRGRLQTLLTTMMAASRDERVSGPNAVWVFTLSEKFEKALCLMGIRVNTLYKGKVSTEDAENAVFGYVKPEESLEEFLNLGESKQSRFLGSLLLGASSTTVSRIVTPRTTSAPSLELVQ